MSLSLVYAFESPVYHIGVDIPAEESEAITVKVDDVPVSPSGSNSPSGSSSSSSKITPDIYTDFSEPESSNKLEELGEDKGTLNLEPEETTGFFSPITGAVVGFVKTGTGIVSIILVLGLAGAFVTRSIRKRKWFKT